MTKLYEVEIMIYFTINFEYFDRLHGQRYVGRFFRAISEDCPSYEHVPLAQLSNCSAKSFFFELAVPEAFQHNSLARVLWFARQWCAKEM